MNYNDAFYIHRGFMCDLSSQSKAINLLLSSVSDFEIEQAAAKEKAENLTPDYIKEQRTLEKKTAVFNDIPDELIEANIKADQYWHAEKIYAGTLFVVLSSWIQTFGKRIGLTQSQWLDTGETIRNQKLSKVIWAAANNFRHYEEWRIETPKSKLSTDVLAGIGLQSPWDRNLSSEVLDIVLFADSEDVWKKMHVIANELFLMSTGQNWRLPHY